MTKYIVYWAVIKAMQKNRAAQEHWGEVCVLVFVCFIYFEKEERERETEREGENEHVGEAETERKNPKLALHCQHKAQRGT